MYELAGACDRDPRLFSLRDLWLLYSGKSRFWRKHCLNQSYAVWGLDDESDPEAFVLMGVIRKRITENFAIPVDLQEEVKRKMDEALRNDGYVIVDLPDLPKRQPTPGPVAEKYRVVDQGAKPSTSGPSTSAPAGSTQASSRPSTPPARRKQRF